jgi:MmyB-like transcription regulator ligand binding domain
MGDDVHASRTTLLGIAKALRLSPAETEYLFQLAGSETKMSLDQPGADIPSLFDVLLPSIRGIGAVLGNSYLTPFRWNAIAEAMFHYSRYATPIDRNSLVRLIEYQYVAEFVGADHENLARNAVGMLRLAFGSGEPEPLAQEIYDRLRNAPLFKRLWQEHTVAAEISSSKAFVRHHDEVGTYSAYPLDLLIPGRKDLRLRLIFPADNASAEKFARLEVLGVPWASE